MRPVPSWWVPVAVPALHALWYLALRYVCHVDQ